MILRRALVRLALAAGILAATPLWAKTLRQGEAMLTRCADGSGWCGSLQRQLDPAGRIEGTVRIGFRWYPPRERSVDDALPPVITMIDGGPGYGATRSAGDYLALAGPLRRRHALLLVDNRGTGSSSALACDLLDGKPGLDRGAVAECGRQLGPAAALYGSALAADDLAAVLDHLQIARTGIYAVSYGTYFMQYFAARHPARIDRLALDSAYPASGGSPFFATSVPALRRALFAQCQRHADRCRPDPQLLDRLLEAIRKRPVSGTAPDSLGVTRPVTLDPGSIYTALMHSSGGLVAYRDFAAAATAYLDHDDPAPLLRLVAEGETLHDPSASSDDPRDFSKTLFAAVSCSDYAKLFSMRAAPPERRRALGEALAVLGDKAEVYRPFTLAELGRSAFQENQLDLCLDWPTGADASPPVPPFAAIPTLVLNGEFDPLTTIDEGAAVARQFPAARQMIVADNVHAPALTDPSGCAAEAVQGFLGGDDAVVSCSARTALPPPPARFDCFARPGSDALREIALDVARDAAARAVFGSERLAGLRGGQVHYRAPDRKGRVRLTLDAVRWTQDTTVSGTLHLDPTSGMLAGTLLARSAEASVTVPFPGSP